MTITYDLEYKPFEFMTKYKADATKNTLLFMCIFFLVISDGLGQHGDRKNILLVISDDLRTELNSYGKTYIKSPNIDKLAEEGYRFTNAFVQQAVCSASRASFLTGTRPNTTGVDYPYSEYFVNEFWPSHPSIPEYFERQGYAVRTFGKIHHGGGSDKTRVPVFHPSGPKYYAKGKNIELGGERGRNENTPPFEAADVDDDAYHDGKLGKEAVKTIRKLSGDKLPFFIAVGFKKPHLPFAAPKKYWDLYDENEIPLTSNGDHPENSPKYSTTHHPLKRYKGPNDKGGKKVPEYFQRKLKHGYAACVSYVDAQVGKLMDELKRNGELDDTIIVFISDHGWHLGDQGMWGKSTNFENATRAPLIVSVPGMQENVELDQLVEYVDLYPTLVDLTGFTPATYLEGTSFVPLLENPDRSWKKAAFSQFPRWNNREGYAIRTENFRYIEWRNKKTDKVIARELYDHRNDPQESVNVAGHPEYQEIVEELASRLEAGWKAALPDDISNKANNRKAPPEVNWKRGDYLYKTLQQKYSVEGR